MTSPATAAIRMVPITAPTKKAPVTHTAPELASRFQFASSTPCPARVNTPIPIPTEATVATQRITDTPSRAAQSERS